MNIIDRVVSAERQLSEIWKLLMAARAAGGAGAHNVLSGTHTDSTPSAAVRGGLIYADSNPKWKQLAKGNSGDVLQADANDVKWGLVPAHASRHQSGGADAIKLDDLAAPDNNTDLDASAAKHGLLPALSGATDEWLRGDGAWHPITSGGSNVINLWVPDAFPASPSAESDHFDDASLAGKWATFNYDGAKMTTEESGTYLRITHTGNAGAGANLRGYYQPLPHPDADFCITAKIGMPHSHGANYEGFSLALIEDAAGAPTTCDLYTWGLADEANHNAPRLSLTTWSAYNAYATNPATLYGPFTTFIYVRMGQKVNAGPSYYWYFDYSIDGVIWKKIYSNTRPKQYKDFGITIDNEIASGTMTAWIDWLYYEDSYNPVLQPNLGALAEFWIT